MLKSASKYHFFLMATSIAIVSSLLLWFGYELYPALGVDSVHYLPPIFERLSTGKMLNSLSPLTPLTDLSGQGRFLFYPPLFQMFVSTLMWNAKPRTFYFVLSLLNFISLCFTCAACFRLSRCRPSSSPLFSSVISFLLPIAFASLLLGGCGRPDTLAVMFLSILCFCVVTLPIPVLLWPLGILLGLMGATHPASAVMSFFSLLIYFSLRHSSKTILKYLALVGSLAIVFFFLGLSLSPYSISEQIPGILRHMRQAYRKGVQPAEQFLPMYFFNPQGPLYGIWLLLISVGSFLFTFTHFSKITSRFFYTVGFIGLIFSVYRFGIYNFYRVYNLLAMAPLLFCLLFWYSFQKPSIFRQTFLLIFLMIFSLGTARAVIQFIPYLNSGISFDQAKALFSSHISGEGGIIMDGPNLWLLAEPRDYSRITLDSPVMKDGQAYQKPFYRTYILQQYMTTQNTPPERVGEFVLKHNFFSPSQPEIFGIRVGKAMQGYGFALYEREPKEVA